MSQNSTDFVVSVFDWVLSHTTVNPIHLATELILFLLLIYLYSTKSYKPVVESLTKREEEELIAEWSPEPIVQKSNAPFVPLDTKVVEGPVRPHVKVNGKDYINLASNGFLGYQFHPKLIKSAIDCAKEYGVGACGPRGFYGSLVPHLDLEKKIADFMGTEDCVVFSSEFQTVGTVIPAFAKPGDTLIVDKGVSLAIQNGLTLSRTNVLWYNHNDMNDLIRVLQSLGDVFAKMKSRVYLVIESIFTNSGDLSDLSRIMELKLKFPFRIILDETFSIGVLGEKGRGITEHFGVKVTDIEIITSSMGTALGTIGGFACGSAAVAEHMRLNCIGYVFSCSLPPYLSRACIESIELLRQGKETKELQSRIKTLHGALRELKKFNVSGSELSPVAHLCLKTSTGNRHSDDVLLEEVVDAVFKRGVIITRAKYVTNEKFLPEPSIKVSVTSLHTEKEILSAVEIIKEVSEKIKEKDSS